MNMYTATPERRNSYEALRRKLKSQFSGLSDQHNRWPAARRTEVTAWGLEQPNELKAAFVMP